MKTSAYEQKNVPISKMFRSAALANDFKHRHGHETATESLDVHSKPPKLSLEANPSAKISMVFGSYNPIISVLAPLGKIWPTMGFITCKQNALGYFFRSRASRTASFQTVVSSSLPCIKGTLLGTPNWKPQEYSSNIMEYKDPGRYIPIIYLLYSWGSLFGVPSRVPLCMSATIRLAWLCTTLTKPYTPKP